LSCWGGIPVGWFGVGPSRDPRTKKNAPIISSPVIPALEEVQEGWLPQTPVFLQTLDDTKFGPQLMAATALSYPLSGRDLARLSISSTSTMSSEISMISGMNYSSSSASSSTSSPPQISISPSEDQMSENGVVTKIEALDDEDTLKNAPPLLSPTEAGEPSKRGRGRPRKHPLPPYGAVQKVTKGRSKTGCITCRRRKKKCDETKPECPLFTLLAQPFESFPLPKLHV